ncbi:MAG: HlyC/CorC family transporter [Alphaproteobacteria bacterium]|jgi:Mg2+/Co2+ transporter CorB|nr:CNNM domain-containing protein [Alphaproteobacteria bacterium]
MDVSVPMILFLSFCVIALIGLSAFFSASETAFVATSKARLIAQIRKGNKKAVAIKKLVDRLETLIGTILICNTLVNTLAASLTTALLTDLLGEAGVVYATFVVTILIVIYAEVVPKLIAINKGDRVTRFMEPLISLLVKVISPITRAIEWIAKRSLALIGVRIDPDTHLSSPLDELRGAIDLLPEGGHSKSEERAMLHSILDLREVDVDEIMIHRQSVSMLDASLPAAELMAKVVQSPYTRFPVWKDNPDNIIGVLHTKDLLRALHAQRKKAFDLTKLLTKPWFIPNTAPLREQLQAFRRKKEHFALVVDEYGSFLGIVTLEDVMEEIVGEIMDEHDEPLAGIARSPNGDLLVSGKTTLRDLNRQFSWDFPDENAATLAGLLIHESRTIPKAGQVFLIRGFRIGVVKRVKNQLVLLRITPPKQDR